MVAEFLSESVSLSLQDDYRPYYLIYRTFPLLFIVPAVNVSDHLQTYLRLDCAVMARGVCEPTLAYFAERERW
jgi:hypothetical protein